MKDITERNRMWENRYPILLFMLSRRSSIELYPAGTVTESFIIFSSCSLCDDQPLDGALTLNLTTNNSNSWLAGWYFHRRGSVLLLNISRLGD